MMCWRPCGPADVSVTEWSGLARLLTGALIIGVVGGVSPMGLVLALGVAAVVVLTVVSPASGLILAMLTFLVQNSSLYQAYGLVRGGASIADLLVALVVFGVILRAPSVRPTMRWHPARSTAALVFALLFFLWIVISCLWSPASLAWIWYTIRQAVEAVTLLTLATVVLNTPNKARRAALAYAGAGALLSLYTIITFRTQTISVASTLPPGDWTAYRGGLAGFDPNQTAFMLALVPVFTLLGTGAWKRSMRVTSFVLSLPLIGWALIILASRTAFVAVTLAALVVLVCAPESRQRLGAAAVIAASAAGFLWVVAGDALPWYVVTRLAAAGHDGVGGRLPLWRLALTLAAQHPLTGLGARGFETVVPASHLAPPGVTAVHSDYLRALVDEGLIGLVLLLLLLVSLARAILIRHRRDAAVLAGLTILLVSMASVSLLLEHWVWVAFSILYAGTPAGSRDVPPGWRDPRVAGSPGGTSATRQ
jgi:O-antigen ligase